ncbi:MAG: hypothetical protein ACRDKE_12535, partial [Solirubrobacterales bacterium]
MKKLTAGPLTVKSALLVLSLGVLAGLSIERLAIGHQPGLGLVISGLVVALSVAVIGDRKRPETYALLAAGSLLMVWSMIRTAEYVVAIDVIAALVLLSLAATSLAFEPRVWMLGLGDHIRSGFDQFISVIAGAAAPLKAAMGGRGQVNLGAAVPYVRGAALAVPVFVVFA